MKFDITPLSKFDYDLEAALRRLTRIEGLPKARATIRKAMQLLINDAKGRVNNRTGHLSSAIQFRFSGKFDATQISEMGVSYKRTKARHAHLVEGGHKGPKPAPPHPFWGPAVDETGPEVSSALADAVNEILDELNL